MNPPIELAPRPCTHCREEFEPKRPNQWLCDRCRDELRTAAVLPRGSLNSILADRLRSRR